jgi:hypothetical protein
MIEWIIYVSIFGGIALGTALAIAYDERALGVTCERRDHNMGRRKQAATQTDVRAAIDKLTVPSLGQAG